MGELLAAGEFFYGSKHSMLWKITIFKGIFEGFALKSQNFPPAAGFYKEKYKSVAFSSVFPLGTYKFP